MFELTVRPFAGTGASGKIQSTDKVIKIERAPNKIQTNGRVVLLHESGAISVWDASAEKLEEHWALAESDVDSKQVKHAQILFYNNETNFAVIYKDTIKTYDIELGDVQNNTHRNNNKHHYFFSADVPNQNSILFADKDGLHIFSVTHATIKNVVKANTQQVLWLSDLNLLSVSSLELDEPDFKIWNYSIFESLFKDPPSSLNPSHMSRRSRLGSDLSSHSSFIPKMIQVEKNKIASTHPKGIKIWNYDKQSVTFDKLIECQGITQLVLLPDQFLLATTANETIIWSLQDCKPVYRTNIILYNFVALPYQPQQYLATNKEGVLVQVKIQRSDLSLTSQPLLKSVSYQQKIAPDSLQNSSSEKLNNISSGSGNDTSESTSKFYSTLEDDKDTRNKKKCCVII